MNFGLLNKKRVIPIFFPWGEFEDSSSKEHFERVFFIKLEKRNGNRLENVHVFSFSEKDLPFLNYIYIQKKMFCPSVTSKHDEKKPFVISR